MTVPSKVDESKMEYAKPAKALHYFYQDTVEAMRSAPGRPVSTAQDGTLKAIAKKIVEAPVPKKRSTVWSTAPGSTTTYDRPLYMEAGYCEPWYTEEILVEVSP